MGPLLFIVYLNDFEKCLKACKAGMYADDTQVSLASSSVDELIRKVQDELGNISEWMRLNKLSANPQKTEYMFIEYPNRANKITEKGKTQIKWLRNKTSEENEIIGGNCRSRIQLGGPF